MVTVFSIMVQQKISSWLTKKQLDHLVASLLLVQNTSKYQKYQLITFLDQLVISDQLEISHHVLNCHSYQFRPNLSAGKENVDPNRLANVVQPPKPPGCGFLFTLPSERVYCKHELHQQFIYYLTGKIQNCTMLISRCSLCLCVCLYLVANLQNLSLIKLLLRTLEMQHH